MNKLTHIDRYRLKRRSHGMASNLGQSGRPAELSRDLQKLADEIIGCMVEQGMDALEAAQEVARRRGVPVPPAA